MKAASDAIIRPEQAVYLDQLLPARDPIATELEQDAARHDVPIVDPEVGRFLEITARACAARRILEIGTATGYSGLHLARGMMPDGELVTIDVDAERQATAQRAFERAGLGERLTLLHGAALEVLPTLRGPFDLLFLDAIKTEYQAYLEFALPLLRVGGVIVADNVLRAGQVASGERSELLDALRDFNRYAMAHPQLVALILPLGDGLLYAVKQAAR